MSPDTYLTNVEQITQEFLASLSVNLSAYCRTRTASPSATYRDADPIVAEHAQAALALARSLGLLGEDSAANAARLLDWLSTPAKASA